MLKEAVKLPELWFTGFMIAIVAILSAGLDLSFNLPAGDRVPAVGIHYIYPLLGVAAWGVFALIGSRKRLASTFLIALPCYAIVMVCHFNLKLWIPHINPTLWDPLYWNIDQNLRPVIEACVWIRHIFAPLFPLDSNAYMVAFITMFYVSFCFHALRTPEAFRTLFLAALLLQGFGALAYMLAPALGPFIYEQGISPTQTNAQLSMLHDYREHIAAGKVWIEQKGAYHLTVGLAAMPSLHSGGSFLFLLLAWHYARVLVPLYAFLFLFIATAAVANRWHYVIDIPVGMALAWACVALARRITGHRAEKQQDVVSPELVPAAA